MTVEATRITANRFSFSAFHYEPASGEARFSYTIDDQVLDEVIHFSNASWPADVAHQTAFLQALEVLYLICGVSYYKAGLAENIEIGTARVDAFMAGFLQTLYTRGLAEFAYTNQLDVASRIHFETNASDVSTALDLDLPERALVAMGGGKDSLVCLQILTDAGLEVQPACVGDSVLIGETAAAAGLSLLRVRRELSPVLAEMNAAGAWNGHVPVTAINSAILACAGLLYGYRYIIFANELSASEANLKDRQGREVNHQYSKSFAFEQDFRAVLARRISPALEYFSLLRPFGEIAITRRFSALTAFHSVFSSCNRNFHLDGSRINTRWCQDCPKCRFTALALAPFMSPQQLSSIQGSDLLDQVDQLRAFKALCGLGEDKPFECVGSIAESRATMKFLATSPQWQDRKIIRALAAHPKIMAAGKLKLQPDPSAAHCIPAAILAKIDAF